MATFVKIIIIIGGTLGILLLLDILFFSLKYQFEYRISKNKCRACEKEQLFLRDKICEPCYQETLELLYKCVVQLENLENEYRQH